MTRVFQQLFLWPHLTNRENITLAVQGTPYQKQLDELPKETILMVGEIADLQLRFDGARKGIFHLHGSPPRWFRLGFSGKNHICR